MMIADMASGQVSISLGLKGPNFCTTSACSSGADAIGIATEMIRRGDTPVMFAGGSEAIINPMGLAGFNALKALSERNDSPREASRPFDVEHDGFVMSEGATVLVLEEMDYARSPRRQYPGRTGGLWRHRRRFHMTQPVESGEGAARAMTQALKKAGLVPSDIDTLTPTALPRRLNDRM
jgi:3-oxoacyl-[acyl-carrier-protein] synthase II